MQIISLDSLIQADEKEGGGDLQAYLLSFKCHKNEEVEKFLHSQAIESEKRSFTRTNLVIDEKNLGEIVGFFSITTKQFSFTTASGANRAKLAGDKRAKSFTSMLIAQLGRSDAYKGQVEGQVILNLALEHCKMIHRLAALRVVCVEYDDSDKLNKFYEENGFKNLQKNSNGLNMSYVRL